MEKVIRTKLGKIRGVQEPHAIVFKGIPFAKAPVGELRWRAPEPVPPWSGVREADCFSDRALQPSWDPKETFYRREFYNEPVYQTPVSEDCLYLNIWIPQKEYDELLPVAFFIHGGAFDHGTGHEIEFRSEEYARRGIILVTCNYRLGIAGFLAHPQLLEEDETACGNYGILDQIMALRWVKEHIEAFGGDPENITLFGQSAGAVSVQTLLCAEKAKGLFQKAILQSGAGYPAPFGKGYSLEKAFQIGEKVLELAGASTIKELRQLSQEQILGMQEQVIQELHLSSEYQILSFAPCMNGSLLGADLDTLFLEGKTADVPVMIGSTLHDLTVTEEQRKSGMTGMEKRCIDWAVMQEKRGRKPVYVYRFDRELPGDKSGAFHSSELWYMFGTWRKCWRPMEKADQELSERMLDYWASFMKKAKPDVEGLPQWKACRQADPAVMKFDIQK